MIHPAALLYPLSIIPPLLDKAREWARAHEKDQHSNTVTQHISFVMLDELNEFNTRQTWNLFFFYRAFVDLILDKSCDNRRFILFPGGHSVMCF